MKYYMGFDNGITGSYAVLNQDGRVLHFSPIPTVSVLSYVKTKVRNRTRINYKALIRSLDAILAQIHDESDMDRHPWTIKAVLERPMINSLRFQASISASASLEAILIALEHFEIPYEYCDSKGWQKMLLPGGIKGSEYLKTASKDIGRRLFPTYADRHTDCDGLLIAEWARKVNL